MTDKEFAKLLNQKRTRGEIKKLKWGYMNKVWNFRGNEHFTSKEDMDRIKSIAET